MEILIAVERQLQLSLKRLEMPLSRYGDVDTCATLYNLASAAVWGETEWKSVNFLSKRMDISCKLFPGYHDNGRKATNLELTDNSWLDLAVAIFLKAALLGDDNQPVAVALQRFNTLFKSVDTCQPEWFSSSSKLGSSVEQAWASLISSLPVKPGALHTADSYQQCDRVEKESTVIPLTVLFYEGPIARAYLETIRSLGFKPQKIIELVAANDVSTKKPVGKWLPKDVRVPFAAYIQRSRISYWPKKLLKTESDFIAGILDEIESKLGFSRETIDRTHSLPSLSVYSDSVESILVEGLSDSGLHQYLSLESTGVILYTGGGIVPAALLNIQHLKFLHIHPGYLPDIRGADCVLWSSLLTGYTSATCFYMSAGIDTGDIISPHWLPKLAFGVGARDVDLSTLYRAVYGFIDPWIRAYVLRAVVNQHQRFDDIVAVSQNEVDGATFHFMHDKLKHAACQQLFDYQDKKM
jgi:hypothetical protein